MDIMLERILSLIPKKENGDFKHGAKKEFAIGIGFKSGEIVSDWISGRSKSYEGYLYQISALHNVSVEWLRGGTDDPTPPEKKESPPHSGEPPKYRQLTPENRAMIDDLIEKLLKSQFGG